MELSAKSGNNSQSVAGLQLNFPVTTKTIKNIKKQNLEVLTKIVMLIF